MRSNFKKNAYHCQVLKYNASLEYGKYVIFLEMSLLDNKSFCTYLSS